MDLRSGRPKNGSSGDYTTCFRYNEMYNTIIQYAVDEFGVSKSEAIRKIIMEWNMLRYNED